MGWFYIIMLQTLFFGDHTGGYSNYAGCGRILFFVQMAMQ